jgi:hypothetical protein
MPRPYGPAVEWVLRLVFARTHSVHINMVPEEWGSCQGAISFFFGVSGAHSRILRWLPRKNAQSSIEKQQKEP